MYMYILYIYIYHNVYYYFTIVVGAPCPKFLVSPFVARPLLSRPTSGLFPVLPDLGKPWWRNEGATKAPPVKR